MQTDEELIKLSLERVNERVEHLSDAPSKAEVDSALRAIEALRASLKWLLSEKRTQDRKFAAAMKQLMQ